MKSTPRKSHEAERAGGRPRLRNLLAGFGLVAALLALPGCGGSGPTVVVYTAQDQQYAEVIFKQFTKETGIRVRPLYDSEAVKTVGLANRLVAERQRPQCDVFWGNEEMRTRQLAAQGVFRETNGWAAFGLRTRRIVVNTNLATALDRSQPFMLLGLTNPVWRGKVALAYPVFGTTCAHFLALRQEWGEEKWRTWCRALQANKPFVVDGNSQVVKLVGRGEAWIGLTDSDDVAVALREKMPVAALPLTRETLLIPNTVGVVRGAPHPEPAQKLFEYLRQRPVIDILMRMEALDDSRPSLRPHLYVDWDRILKDLEPATAEMQTIFRR